MGDVFILYAITSGPKQTRKMTKSRVKHRTHRKYFETKNNPERSQNQCASAVTSNLALKVKQIKINNKNKKLNKKSHQVYNERLKYFVCFLKYTKNMWRIRGKKSTKF